MFTEWVVVLLKAIVKLQQVHWVVINSKVINE